ncbi:MAG: hypothetical protein ACK5LL_14235 [Suipraeoptans sp.]
MGTIINVSGVRGRISEENASLNNFLIFADKLENKITSFVNDKELLGDAYGSMKNYFSSIHIPLIGGLICLAENKITENSNYSRILESYFGDTESIVDEDKIKQKLSIIRKIKVSIDSIIPFNFYFNVLNSLEKSYEDDLLDIQNFVNETNNLYIDKTDNFLNNIVSGLDAISSVKYDAKNGIYNLDNVDQSWKLKLLEAWENSQYNDEASINQLRKDFYDSLPDGIKLYITMEDIVATSDGFVTCTESLAGILYAMGTKKIIVDGKEVSIYDYYDDWYLYGIEARNDSFTYSLLKLREQEYDVEGDSNRAGAMISFIEADLDNLFKFNHVEEFKSEVQRVIRDYSQNHNSTLTDYFKKHESRAGYLIADLYVDKVLSHYSDGRITTEGIKAVHKNIERWERLLYNTIDYKNQSKIKLELNKSKRVPDALREINGNAGYDIYNSKTGEISIKDTSNPTHYEKQAIMATHTGNVNYNSFVAEIQFHAEACESFQNDIPYFGRKLWYRSAMHADMDLGEELESGNYDEYYDLDSNMVKEQERIHGKK